MGRSDIAEAGQCLIPAPGVCMVGTYRQLREPPNASTMEQQKDSKKEVGKLLEIHVLVTHGKDVH